MNDLSNEFAYEKDYKMAATTFNDIRAVLSAHYDKDRTGRIKEKAENKWLDTVMDHVNRTDAVVAELLARKERSLILGDVVLESSATRREEANRSLAQQRDTAVAIAQEAVTTMERLRGEMGKLEVAIAGLPNAWKPSKTCGCDHCSDSRALKRKVVPKDCEDYPGEK